MPHPLEHSPADRWAPSRRSSCRSPCARSEPPAGYGCSTSSWGAPRLSSNQRCRWRWRPARSPSTGCCASCASRPPSAGDAMCATASTTITSPSYLRRPPSPRAHPDPLPAAGCTRGPNAVNRVGSNRPVDGQSHAHDHGHADGGGHGHAHGGVDAAIVRGREAMRTLALSLLILGTTATLQVGGRGASRLGGAACPHGPQLWADCRAAGRRVHLRPAATDAAADLRPGSERRRALGIAPRPGPWLWENTRSVRRDGAV
jgi:hypothetical protein